MRRLDRSDFSHYRDVSKENVLATYYAFPAADEVVLFRIEEGRLSVVRKKEMLLNGTAEHGLKIYTHIFEYVAKQGYVKNLYFLVRLSDFILKASEQQVALSAPILTTAKDLSKTKEQKFILIPDYMSLEDMPKIAARILQANKLFLWENKQAKIFWRGSYADVSGFRHQVVAFSEKNLGFSDAKFTVAPQDLASMILNRGFVFHKQGNPGIRSDSFFVDLESDAGKLFKKGVRTHTELIVGDATMNRSMAGLIQQSKLAGLGYMTVTRTFGVLPSVIMLRTMHAMESFMRDCAHENFCKTGVYDTSSWLDKQAPDAPTVQ